MFGKSGNQKHKRQYDDDDGRVISPMNIDGMPWHSQSRPIFRGKEEEPSGSKEPPLTRKETFRLTVNALLAALLIAAVFGIVALLFILFCVYVWF